jgi:HSP20 family molecular chaperone IbpA
MRCRSAVAALFGSIRATSLAVGSGGFRYANGGGNSYNRWVAAKLILGSFAGSFLDQAFDELFEELLIDRWYRPMQVRNLGDAVIAEHDDEYRVKIAAPSADPNKLEVEVTEWRLTVRIPVSAGKRERTFDFGHRLDVERVSARYKAGVLEICLPKATGRRIEIN